MKRKKGKFIKESISSMDYAEQYYRKNEEKIKRLMPYIEDVNDFKMVVKYRMDAPEKFSSKTIAKDKMDDFIREASGVDMDKLHAKRQAFNINGEEFGFSKIQQLNKKIGDYNDMEFEISDTEKVVGYYDIKNSNAILAQVEIKEPNSSPYFVYKFVSRSYLG